jgi:hypothetical protein
MPSRKRIEQEKLKRLLNTNPRELPEHIKIRLRKPSKVNLETPDLPPVLSYRGLQTNERGETWLPLDHGKSANKIRGEKALQRAISLEIKYAAKFWDRKYTGYIAKNEIIDPTTLRRMRARLQKSGQAKFCP